MEKYKDFWKYAGIRAIKTICQTAVAMLPAGININEVGWGVVLGTSIMAGILSILTSVATGLPEAKE